MPVTIGPHIGGYSNSSGMSASCENTAYIVADYLEDYSGDNLVDYDGDKLEDY